MNQRSEDRASAATGPGEFTHRGDTPVHRGNIWDVVVATFESPEGDTFERDLVRSPGAVAVVPVLYDAEGNPSVVLVDQYRPAHDEFVLEIPAGMRDVDGEPPEQTARRELAEEVGLAAEQITHLADTYPSPGMTDSVTIIFLATGCRPVPKEPHGPEELHSEVVHLPLADALDAIEAGRIRDGKTIIGLYAVERTLRC